jgi:NitT/TauT family transport system substrate-binding protein
LLGQADSWTRRRFVGGITLAGASGLLGLRSERAAAEPPPEVTAVRISHSLSLCAAPQFIAEELLRAEGFADVQYVKPPDYGLGQWRDLSTGKVDVGIAFSGPLLMRLEAQDPLVILAGIHVGCFELFGTDRVRAVRDLKGKRVVVYARESVAHVFVAAMAAHVGLHPGKDIEWVVVPYAEGKRLFVEGKVDAYMAFPPDPQEFREKKIGHVVVNSALDKPWSQYFCCTLVANREFVHKHPVATKRVVRAMLKATDLCATEPDRVARYLVERGYTPRLDLMRQALGDIPFNKWRVYDPEDTVRFYALRLREAGMLKASPQKLIADGTDWRFLKELKKELKA